MSRNYYASDVLSTVSSKSTSTPSTLTKFTEGTITGAIIGSVAGVVYGKFTGRNIYITGFIGMIIGGVVSKVITM